MHSFFLAKIGQIKEFDDVPDRELAFLDNKNIDLKKSQNLHFSKGISLRFWSKNENFFNNTNNNQQILLKIGK